MTSTKLRPVRVTAVGAGRGLSLDLPYLQQFNKKSEIYKIEMDILDPVPGLAAGKAARASAMGVPARGMEGRVETYLPELSSTEQTVILGHVDRGPSLASVMRASIGVPILAYIVVQTPNLDLMGIRVVAESNDGEIKEMIAQFFDRIGDVTARRGHNAIFGENGEPSHLSNEPLYRAWFANHCRENLPKLVSGLEPDSAPIEITRDGVTSMPLLVRNNPFAWSDPLELARQVADSGVALVRGENFVVGELGPGGVRFHQARVRRLDGDLSVKRMGVAVPRGDNDPGAFTSSQPLFTTD